MLKVRKVDISPDVESVLANAEVTGNVLKIHQQLPRDLYVAVNKVLEALGGKWNRSERGHVFDGDPRQKIAEALSAGQAVDIKKTTEYFETPRFVAEMLVEIAELRPGMKVLEPSAGRGAIASVISATCPDCKLEVVEIEEGNRKFLKAESYRLVGKDFMKFKKKGYDRVLMNPPFSKQQDIDHVRHAWNLLKPGGRVVSVMSPGTKFRQNKKAVEFQKLMDEHGGQSWDLPPETFKESGTSVATIIVMINK